MAAETRHERWLRDYAYGIGTGEDDGVIGDASAVDPTRFDNTWTNQSQERKERDDPFFDR